MTRIHARLAAAAVVLTLLTVSPAVFPAEPAASAPPAATDAQASPAENIAQVQELDEVVVRGKRVMEQIVQAEDEFYKLFNDLNKDDKYDSHCVYLQLTDSRIQNRMCIPGFVADAMAEYAPFKARCQPPQDMKYGKDGPEFACLDRNNNGRLTFEEASARPELASAFFEIDADRDGAIIGDEFTQALETRPDLTAPPTYTPPTPDSVLVNGTKKWQEHMTQVVNSDPRLHEMADHLGDLYYELGKAQLRYDELDLEAKKKVGKVLTGPRGR